MTTAAVAGVTRTVTVPRIGYKAPNGRSHRIRVRFSWVPSYPLAVRLVFLHPLQGPVPWVISRDVLEDGLQGPAGLGDVAVLPDMRDHRRVELVLESPVGRAGYRVPREFLAGFLGELPVGEWDVTANADAWLAKQVTS